MAEAWNDTKSDWQSAITVAEPTTETSHVLNLFRITDRVLKLSVNFGLRWNALPHLNCLFFIHVPLAEMLRHCRPISRVSEHVYFLQPPPHQQPQILQKMCSRPTGHQTLLIRFPKSTLHCLRPFFTVQLSSHCFIKWILRRILNYMWTVRYRVLKQVTILHSPKKICTFQLWSRAFWTFQIPSTWLYILSKQVYTFRFKWPYKDICLCLSCPHFYLYAANVCSINFNT